MKKPNEELPKTEEGFVLQFRSRPATPLSIQIPVDTLASLEQVAASHDMSIEALIKFYVGQGLRQDLAKLFADRVLEKTAQVLTRHIQSEEEVSAILKEIRVEAVV
ncbi:MAG: hypothetical protein HYR94_20030 [Chloroflexi bacterium]|nr:hypothetical protein [Chloroflexota bacterium]